jgi:hypothetical protein
MSKKEPTELELVTALQNEHGYRVLDVGKEADRYAWLAKLGTGTGRTVRVVRLCVPVKSELAKAMNKSAALAKRAAKARAKRRGK